MALCKIQIIGNLGRDPELRYTPNGRPVATFSVAVNQATKNQQTGEWIEATDWFRVSVWGDRAERSAENLRKGNRVFVDGRFRTREYETNDGRKGLSLDVSADQVIGLDRRDQEGTFAGAPGAQGAQGGAPASSGAPGGGPGGQGGTGGGAGGFDDTEIDELPF